MSLTAVGFLIVYACGLFLAVARHPGYGLFAYFYVFYNDPPERWWGADLPNLRWSLMAALVTMLAVFLKSGTSSAGIGAAPPAKRRARDARS